MGKNYSEYFFKSGDMQGVSYEEATKTEQGRDKLRFMASQAIPGNTPEKLRYWLMGRNKWIKEKLAPYENDVSQIETPQVENKTVDMQSKLIDHEVRIGKLEAFMIKDAEQVWDEA